MKVSLLVISGDVSWASSSKSQSIFDMQKQDLFTNELGNNPSSFKGINKNDNNTQNMKVITNMQLL